MPTSPLTATELSQLDAFWRAANYLSVGQIYLLENPLLQEPLEPRHIKPRLLGHWGTTPALTLLYAHLNRIIRKQQREVLFITGPGHGGPGILAGTYLDGTYSEVYPEISLDILGMQRLFRQFSFPGGVPSHVAPETPGSIHEGGELGYSLSHAYGAAFDNPNLLVACVVGDGEAETGPLATSWHGNKFLNPATDGAVLPVLQLNGYKIANPSVLARLEPGELQKLMEGYGHEVFWVHAEDPLTAHQSLAATLDTVTARITDIQTEARAGALQTRARWPMIILQTPKGWTGPTTTIDGLPLENHWRSHQVPLVNVARNAQERKMLEEWMLSYRPEELFDANGTPLPYITQLVPQEPLRMSASPHANGGELLKDLRLPDFRDYAVPITNPGSELGEATKVLGTYLTEVMRRNEDTRNFRLFGPDETDSNRLGGVYEVTGKQWNGVVEPTDTNLTADGRVLEILSEHTCQGWLEGYLLTGRHGLFSCYEAFIHIVDSMVNQHAKWLKTTRGIPWRRPIASLNYLLTSHVWRQDHNGFSHQDPGFLNHIASKRSEVVRIYLPPDANTLISVADHCLRSRHYVNVIVSGKQPAPQYLTCEQAIAHCARGLGTWDWASSDLGSEPDVVLAAAGDVPTLEALAAAKLLREHLPALKVRYVNVVDLMALEPTGEHPHGLSDHEFDALFTKDKPVIFAFHGYPYLVHQLTYRRTNHQNIHVRGYKEEGTTTTPFDMVMRNDLDRYKLVIDVIDRVPGLVETQQHLRQAMQEARITARQHILEHGDDPEEIRSWTWTS